MSYTNNKVTYLNTAAVGRLSEASIQAVQRFQNLSKSNPSGAFFDWMSNQLPLLREGIAKLVHTRVAQVAFTPNFSFSLLTIIHTLRPKMKKVLLFEDDYPSLNLPFELGGWEVSYLKSQDEWTVSIAEIQRIIERDKIEVLAISHVQFLTGYTIDLEVLSTICQDKGVILIVDTTQSMGAVEMNFDELQIDVMISSSYKWLNGGMGSAVMCIKEEFMQRFSPRIAGFGSMLHSEEGWTYTPSLKSYEPGHLNPIGLIQLQQAVEERLKRGVLNVEQHNLSNLKYLSEQLSSTSFKATGAHELSNLSTILCFDADKIISDKLEEHDIIVTWRKGKIRVSPHFHNTPSDIDRLVQVLKE